MNIIVLVALLFYPLLNWEIQPFARKEQTNHQTHNENRFFTKSNFVSRKNLDGLIKSIDKRTVSSADGNVHFMVFISKPTKLLGGQNAGHAYVVWGVEDNANKISYGEAWGLYPLNSMTALTLATVPGELRKEGISSNNYNRLIVKVDKKVYDAARTKMKEWASKGSYQLLERDCLSFTIDMAGIAALKTPPRTGYENIPWNYLIALIGSN